MNAANAMHRLQQLANLNLPEQVLMPSFLEQIQTIIPAKSSSYCWLNHNADIVNVCDQLQPINVSKQLIKFKTTANKNLKVSLQKYLSELDAPRTNQNKSSVPRELVEFYRMTLLKLGYIYSCFIPVINQRTQKRMGLIVINRGKDDPNFSEYELSQLHLISQTLAEALIHDCVMPVHMTDGWRNGLVIIDDEGTFTQACPIGEELLTMALRPKLMEPLVLTDLNLNIIDGIRELIKNLKASSMPSINVPVIYCKNAWGEFKIVGYRVEDKEGRRSAQIGLNISLQAPFPLKLFRHIHQLELTPRQEDVALFYCAGYPIKLMAYKLGISDYTVKEHIKNIFDRLNIRSRAELIQLILCEKNLAGLV